MRWLTKDAKEGAVLAVVALGLAGALGAVARYGVMEWVARRWPHPFPLATLLINVSGAFALGLVLSLAPGQLSSNVRAALGTGFLGGYTTFSTLSFETHTLARQGYTRLAWLNGLASLIAGLVAVALGILLGHALG